MKARLIPLEDHETSALMRSSQGRALVLKFGIGCAALDADASPWAVPLLTAMRELVLIDGAGI